MVQKTFGDPLAAVQASGEQVAFLANVVNDAPAAQLAQITANYPSMFPANQPQPIFQYTCDTPTGAVPCASAGAYNAPQFIRDVDITLIVMTPQRDLQTTSVKLIELNGRGHRLNPVN